MGEEQRQNIRAPTKCSLKFLGDTRVFCQHVPVTRSDPQTLHLDLARVWLVVRVGSTGLEKTGWIVVAAC